jgi:hypothetical protein
MSFFAHRQQQVHPTHSTAVRLEAMEALTRLAVQHLEYAPETVRELRKLFPDAPLTIPVIRCIPRLGDPAKDALPELRKLRFSNTRELRNAATAAIELIEANK